jgi:RNA polymerase sigma-70 factor (ECF subfamily)
MEAIIVLENSNTAPAERKIYSKESLEEIYEAHYKRVYCLCLKILKNTADAEDMTQEVFMQVGRKIDTFRGESALTTWLYRVTFNQVLMYKRKLSSQIATIEIPDGNIEMLGATTPTPQKKFPEFVDRIALLRAVEQLASGYRIVFLLHDMQGYEHEEIGKMLGVSAGTSKSQLHKARKRLRELLLKETEKNDS